MGEEYQLKNLKSACEKRLLRYQTLRLELVTLADKYNLPDLLRKASDDCVQNISSDDIEGELNKPENKCISYESLYKIYR